METSVWLGNIGCLSGARGNKVDRAISIKRSLADCEAASRRAAALLLNVMVPIST